MTPLGSAPTDSACRPHLDCSSAVVSVHTVRYWTNTLYWIRSIAAKRDLVRRMLSNALELVAVEEKRVTSKEDRPVT